MNGFLYNLRRAAQVLRVLVKYGAPPLFRRMWGGRPLVPASAERVRLAAEELGLTYLKLGQFLATRYDILPVDVCRELTKLFDRVPAMPFAVVRQLVETELRRPLETLYAQFAETPIAAGSLAQVHKAYSTSGEALAVKVQRAGIRRVLEADMRILRLLAALADALMIGGVISIRSVVNGFFTWTEKELDFLVEGQTAGRLRANAAPREIVPRVRWDLTTSRVLTMTLVTGLNLSQIRDLLDRGGQDLLKQYLPGLRLDEALHTFTTVYLRQLFITGFFHGDPHPGNILLRDDNSVAFVDCGISGELWPAQRADLLGYYRNLAAGDIEKSARFYTRLTERNDYADAPAFQREVEEILQQWYAASLNPSAGPRALHWGRYVNEIVTAAARHGVTLRSDFLMWSRAIGMLNTNLLMFSVDFLSELRSFFARMHASAIGDLANPENVLESLRTAVAFAADEAPYAMQALNRAASGRFPGVICKRPSRAAKRSARSRNRALAVSLLGVSSAVLAASGDDAVFRTSFAAAAILCLAWPLMRTGQA